MTHGKADAQQSSSPTPRDATTRSRMRKQGRADTGPELEVRRRLHWKGLRYRVDFRPESDLRTRGDIVFTKKRVVVFIHGCFWHRCPLHGTVPKNNRVWWVEKLEANEKRDRRNVADLTARGWTCLQFWEHDDPETVADEIAAVVGGQPCVTP